MQFFFTSVTLSVIDMSHVYLQYFAINTLLQFLVHIKFYRIYFPFFVASSFTNFGFMAYLYYTLYAIVNFIIIQ